MCKGNLAPRFKNAFRQTTRLPFSPIDPKTQKKRKLSSDFGNQSSKSLRTEAVLSEKEECVSPKHSNDIEIIASSNQDSVVEEKENLKCKSTEKIIKHNVEATVEDSNDGIEVMKEKEKEEKRQKREEERLKREEKKEEERLKKEEEKQKREEKLLAEEEEREKQKKLKAKFAQFFVPKKVDSQNQQKESENSSSDNFVHFQVKENMKIAPVVRRSLSQKDKLKLEGVLQTPLKEINYLQEIKEGGYLKGKSCKTFPPVDKLEDDEICEIISDEEDIDGTDVLEVKSCQRKRFKAKFLKFCENNRPAYYGTWSKKSLHINGRKPFRKEEDENVQKERLKQKQEEFELEMKQKTKQLKPKVYGCVWLGDKSSHQAYDQLLKILMPYKAMVMFGSCPIELGGKEMNNQELKENDDDEGHEDDSGKKYFVKSFPEKAIPDLIRLIHGNRHSKLFLMREFSEYWKKKQGEEADADS
ncbi:Chromatin assembly factor 1 subunit A-B, partial [Armadillidium nasatum]